MVNKKIQHQVMSLMIEDLMSGKFFGSLVVKFEEGNIVHIHVGENKKIPALIERYIGAVSEKEHA